MVPNEEPKQLKAPNPASSSFWHRYRISFGIFAGTVVLLGSFYVGVLYYISRVSMRDYRVPVRHFAEPLSAATGVPLTISFDEKQVTVSPKEMQAWVVPYTRTYTGKKDLMVAGADIADYIEAIAPGFAAQPVNARLGVKDGNVAETEPPVKGRTLDTSQSTHLLIQGLMAGQHTITLAVTYIEPAITLEKARAMGITGLLATGESNFVGSPAARIHNIRVGSAKYNGFIIQPDEEFSFNTILGEVDAASGYQPEKVIKQNKLVYEYGGGLCQVSTTMFRAAIYAGLPILERRPHAFPVRYYNPQGFDATIYPGVTDLRFKNNTNGPILIQTAVQGTKLVFDFFGVLDRRIVTLGGPYQYDIQPDGAMKAYFTRTITYEDGSEPKKESFYSNYHSPALYPLERNPLE